MRRLTRTILLLCYLVLSQCSLLGERTMSMALPRTDGPEETAASCNQREAKHTALAIEDLAVQFSRPLSEVQEILQTHLFHLDQRARIKQFVPLLAIKQVKELLRTNQRTEHQFPAHRSEPRVIA